MFKDKLNFFYCYLNDIDSKLINHIQPSFGFVTFVT